MRDAWFALLLRAILAPFAFAFTMPAAWSAPAEAPARVYAAFDASINDTKSAMMGDPEKALSLAQRSVSLAAQLPHSQRAEVARATAGWLHGEALIGMNEVDKAAPITAAALAIAERTARNTKLNGDLLRSRGSIAAMKGDVLAALRDYQRAYQVFSAAKVPRSEAIALQDIGQIYWNAGDYPRVLEYYNQSGEVFSGDPALTLTMHNNRAEVYRKQRRFADAAIEYRAALAEARTLDSSMLQTRILTNLAGSEAEAGNIASAQSAVDQAMRLARTNDAAGWRPFVYGVAAEVAAQAGNTSQAALLFSRAFDGVDLTKSDMLFRDYHLAASKLYESQGDREKALAHFKAFQRLDSEAQSLTASTASQLMGARFDFANQNLKISKLKEDQLARDVKFARLQLAAVSVFFGLLLIGFIQVRRSRNIISAANDSLTLSNTSLEKALRAKAEFLAMTSHEIRTPLNGILGMTQVILSDRTVATDLRERIEVVNSAGETMRALVDDILDVAKMESGELTIAHERTDLGAILRETERLWAGQAESKKLDLVIKTDTAPRYIMSDGGRVRQIIFNLMSNGLKFTEAGQVTLSVVAERLSEGKEELVIRVSDTGIGIPAEMHEEIFQSFKQGDAGVTRKYGGTGLGLAICRRLADGLGGRIDVESELGQGATFTVRLPLTRPDGATDAQVAVDDEQALAKAALLIVDSNSGSRAMMAMLLSAHTESVAVAGSTGEAVAAIGTGDISHILFDARTVLSSSEEPVMALRAVARAADEARALLTILIAGGGELTIADVMTVGASQLIVKPIEIDEMIAALKTLYTPDPEIFIAPSFNAHAA
jgi:signal transduction histidine kinase/CheY-like chemotaxis protein